MKLPTVLMILVVAALLEAGGDALVRSGMHAHATATKLCCFLFGALVLFSYGYMVNAPGWNFGKLLGIYVVFFFVIAQAIGWVVFHERPDGGILLGGAFIVTGGLILSINALR